jgi:murein DD-endopeptidase MepM/ murein hydrolase activator NlpD
VIYQPNSAAATRVHARRQAIRHTTSRRFGPQHHPKPLWLLAFQHRLHDFYEFFRAIPVATKQRALLSLGLLLVAVVALPMLVLPQTKVLPSTQFATLLDVPLALPKAGSTALTAPKSDVSNELYLSSVSDDRWTVLKVTPGQTFGALGASVGLSAADIHRVTNLSSNTAKLGRLFPGQTVAVRIENAKLKALQFDADEQHRVVLNASGAELNEKVIELPLQYRTQSSSVKIGHTLFGSATAAGMSDALVVQMVDIFNFDIDFAQDIQPGDSFSVVWNQVYRNGEKLRDGEILAATFINGGKRFEAYRFVHDDGGIDYLRENGRSLRKAFIRTPVDFTRISSKFSSGRQHPILGLMRAHKGVDYAAPTGTAIKASGAGVIKFHGWQNGYGNVIHIQHGGHVETVYGHMSKFAPNLRVGSKVTQGEIIGYVGMTGLATGPHLHYEFRIDGMHRDPLSVDLPTADPLNGAELVRFNRTIDPWLAQIKALETTILAKAESLPQR